MRKFVCLLSLFLTVVMLTSCSLSVSKNDADYPVVTIETYSPVVTTTEDSTASASTDTEPVTATSEETTVTSEATSESTTVITSDTTVVTSATTSETTVTTTEQTTTTTEATTFATTTEEVTTLQSYSIEPCDDIMYATDNLNVRKEPDADSKRVGRYDKGDEVVVTGIVSNGWVRVMYEGEEYYVNGSYLTYERENNVTTSATTEAATTTTTEFIEEEEIVEDELQNVIIGNNSYSSLNYADQKAIWFAYIDIDLMLKGASEEEFRSKISTAFNNVAVSGFNTVYVHVRAFGDAYYFSDYYDFTAAYSGEMGVRPDYDPLMVMIEEAHSKGLSFHAWINPMRTTDKARFKQMDDEYTLKKWYNSSSANGTYLVYNSKTEFYWLSPAYPAVRELICNGIAELVTNYNIDAIHIDDYFYPTTSTEFDEAAYKASGTTKTLSDWRRSVVSVLVKEMYQTVKSCNSTVLFGISPAGNTKNNYESYYADIYTWGGSAGYCDYMVPQIYYGFNDKLPFDTTVAEWQNIVTHPSVKLICGIAAYKVGSNDEWSSGDIIRRQVDIVSSNQSYDGIALYRYDMIYNPADDVKKLMNTELYNLFR